MSEPAGVSSTLGAVTDPGIKPDESRQLYEQWSTTYDKDVAESGELNYQSPAEVAAEVARLLKDRKQARILDLAAGTGLAAEQIIKYGFSNLDAVDASAGMLEVARQKKIYTNLIEAYITPEPMPIDQDTYDVVVAAGCFGPGHLKADVFEEIIRIIKPGGYFVVILRDYIMSNFEASLQRLQMAGRWRVIERRPADTEYVTGPGTLLTLQIS